MKERSLTSSIVDESLKAIIWLLTGAILALSTVYPVSLKLILDEVEVNCINDAEQYESDSVVVYVSLSGQVKRIKCDG